MLGNPPGSATLYPATAFAGETPAARNLREQVQSVLNRRPDEEAPRLSRGATFSDDGEASPMWRRQSGGDASEAGERASGASADGEEQLLPQHRPRSDSPQQHSRQHDARSLFGMGSSSSLDARRTKRRNSCNRASPTVQPKTDSIDYHGLL